MTTTKKKGLLDEIIEEFVGGDPKRQAMLDEETVNFESAQLVYDLRTKAGLTQRQLARKVGTTASVICRMEQADYDGSLAMLRRITGALNQRLELRAVPIRTVSTSAKRKLVKSNRLAPVGRKKLARVR
jgi:ribosome-binding protein aMBF1 (putative translation factor)